ncbi:hypothetical protein JCM10207_000111 [Rhodosporidiobolus poonsookiae]
MGFLTSAAIVTSSFLIGVLFTSLLFDATVLYGLTAPPTAAAIEAVEEYYLTWWNGAMAVKIFLHVVMFVLLISLVFKWARKSETAYYFTGGSILMLVLTLSLYIVILVPSVRVLAKDPLNKSFPILPGEDFFTRLQAYFTARNSGILGDRARENAARLANLEPMTFEERIMHVQVMCAGNTIAMVLLVGIVLLQVSEWYLDEQIAAEELDLARQQLAASSSAAPATAVAPATPASGKKGGKVTAEKKKQ